MRFPKADPKQAARVLRGIGGGAALLFAAFLLFRGEIGVAVPGSAVFGLGMLGWVSWPATFGARSNKSAGQASQVRTTFLEMELDHDSGRMTGRVLAGRQQGAVLDTLGRAALLDLFDEIDRDSRELLAAYLDRREPGVGVSTRKVMRVRGAAAGPPSGGKMTEKEAYQILGIEPGADADAVTRAHRSLMKKLHPDQGGDDVSRGPRQRGQGCSSSPPSLRYSVQNLAWSPVRI